MRILKHFIPCIPFVFSLLCFQQLFAIQIVNEKEILLPASFTPSRLCVDALNQLYIIDNNLQKVIKMSESGNIMDTLVRGEGRSIKETEGLCDIAYGNGKIVISDIPLGRISIFDTTGKFINSFLTSRKHIFPTYIKTDGETILIRALKEEISDSITFEGWLLQKYDINGKLLNPLIYKKLSQAVLPFIALPFEVDWEKKRLFVLIPLADAEMFDFNGKRIRSIHRECWLHMQDIGLLGTKYLLIASYAAGEMDTVLPAEVKETWETIRTDKAIREMLKGKGIINIFEGNPKFAKEVNYILDIYDIEKDEFILTNYLSPGKLLGCHGNYVFFGNRGSIVKVKVK